MDVKYTAYVFDFIRKCGGLFPNCQEAQEAVQYGLENNYLVNTPAGLRVTMSGGDFITDFIAD